MAARRSVTEQIAVDEVSAQTFLIISTMMDILRWLESDMLIPGANDIKNNADSLQKLLIRV